MDKPKFTPGPWALSGICMHDGTISIAKDRVVMAYVTNAASFGDFLNAALRGRTDFGAPDTATTQFANARLIAAAPELYEALRQLKGNAEIARRHMATTEGAKIVASALFDTIGQADAALSKAIGNTTEEGRRVPHD